MKRRTRPFLFLIVFVCVSPAVAQNDVRFDDYFIYFVDTSPCRWYNCRVPAGASI